MTDQLALNKYIDHTLLKADATADQIIKLCAEAAEHNFATVCVNPSNVSLAAKELVQSDVEVCTVIGFPLGSNDSQVKAFETMRAVELGAHEIDMVINIGALKSGNYQLVQEDIEAVVGAAKGKPVKVIIETALLNEEEKRKACQLSLAGGAQFVKTSTGFSTGGATLEDVRLMKEEVGDQMQVKASGGVRDKETAMAMIEAGASRLGTSSGIALMAGEKSQSSY